MVQDLQVEKFERSLATVTHNQEFLCGQRLQERDSQGTQNKDQNTDRSTRVLHSKYTVYHIYRTECTISIVDTAEFYLGISTAVLFVRKLTLPVCSVISSLISGASFLTPAKSFEALVVLLDLMLDLLDLIVLGTGTTAV